MVTIPDRSVFQKLREDTEVALEAAEKVVEDAVNWAGASVTSVSFVVNEDGDTWFQVHIDEASPDAYKLRNFVAAYLRARGYGSVEVITEW